MFENKNESQSPLCTERRKQVKQLHVHKLFSAKSGKCLTFHGYEILCYQLCYLVPNDFDKIACKWQRFYLFIFFLLKKNVFLPFYFETIGEYLYTYNRLSLNQISLKSTTLVKIFIGAKNFTRGSKSGYNDSQI